MKKRGMEFFWGKDIENLERSLRRDKTYRGENV